MVLRLPVLHGRARAVRAAAAGQHLLAGAASFPLALGPTYGVRDCLVSPQKVPLQVPSPATHFARIRAHPESRLANWSESVHRLQVRERPYPPGKLPARAFRIRVFSIVGQTRRGGHLRRKPPAQAGPRILQRKVPQGFAEEPHAFPRLPHFLLSRAPRQESWKQTPRPIARQWNGRAASLPLLS